MVVVGGGGVALSDARFRPWPVSGSALQGHGVRGRPWAALSEGPRKSPPSIAFAAAAESGATWCVRFWWIAIPRRGNPSCGAIAGLRLRSRRNCGREATPELVFGRGGRGPTKATTGLVSDRTREEEAPLRNVSGGRLNSLICPSDATQLVQPPHQRQPHPNWPTLSQTTPPGSAVNPTPLAPSQSPSTQAHRKPCQLRAASNRSLS